MAKVRYDVKKDFLCNNSLLSGMEADTQCGTKAQQKGNLPKPKENKVSGSFLTGEFETTLLSCKEMYFYEVFLRSPFSKGFR